ncbi:MAG TPA: hypothetical protein VNO26_11110 [Candidatus Limnocylindria bacterium]|nr:hypothetical protein [Candidatus Limnocylindria bacterium]
MRIGGWVLTGLVVALAAAVARADEPTDAPKPAPPPYRYDGLVTAGYRNVDIDGSRDKYREDYNLRSGGRLFAVELTGRATDQDAEWVDRFHLEVDTPHDEPVSHFLLTASDARRYELRASWVRSKYFYEVPQLWEEPVPGDVRLDDLHDFDTTRSDGVVDLRVRLTDTATLIAGYRLYQRHGDSVTTVFVPGGDTFLVRAPIDSDTNVGRLAGEFEALGASFLVQQDSRHVARALDRNGPAGLPAAGVDPTDPSTLLQETVHQDETIDAPTTTARFRRPIGERGEVTGAYVYQHAELDAEQTSFLNATRDNPAVPQVDRSRGNASASLDTQVADLTGSWRLTDRVGLHLSYRYDEQQQDGDLAQLGTGGVLVLDTAAHVRINRVTGEVEAQPRDDLRVRAGLRWAQRNAGVSTATRSLVTDAIGGVADVRYRPWQRLSLFGRYESAHIDDPYVSAGAPLAAPPLPQRDIALTFVNRGSAGFRLQAASWAQLHYTFLADSRTNSSFAGRSRAYGNQLALALDPLDGLSCYFAYSFRSLANEADIYTAPTYDVINSIQSGDENVVQANVTYAFGLWKQRWTTGADFLYVASRQKLAPKLEPGPGTHTFHDLDRVDGGVFVSLLHPWLEPSLEFRMVNYEQPRMARNDYRATIILAKVTKRWGR